MTGSQIIRDLKISVYELLEYGRLLEVNLEDPKVEISNQTFQQIKDLHNNEITRDRVFEIAMTQKADVIGAFRDDQVYKIPAKIKWFGNESTGGDYGFLEAPVLGDVFFHYDAVENIERANLRSEKFVLAELPKNDFEINKKKSAGKVLALEAEKDIFFMLHCFSRIFRSATANLRNYNEGPDTILEQFHKNIHELQFDIGETERIYFTKLVLQLIREKYIPYKVNIHFERLIRVFKSENFTPKNKEEIDEITRKFILKESYNFGEFNFILEFRKFCDLNIDWELDEFIREVSPEKDLYYWWSKHKLNVPAVDILDNIVEKINLSPQGSKNSLDRLSEEELNELFRKAFQNILNDQENRYTSEQVGGFVKLSFDFNKSLDLSLLGEERLFELWNGDYIDYFPVNAVRTYLKNKRKEELESEKDTLFISVKRAREFIKKLDSQHLRDLVASIALDDDKIKTPAQFAEIKYLFDNLGRSKAEEIGIVDLALEYSNEFYKLQLFIADFTDNIDYDEAVLYTGILESKKQKLFFKKLIKLIEEKKLQLSLEDLNRIITIDYETSEGAREIDGVGLDFSLSIILKILNDLKSKELTKTETIFSIVASQIKRPSDLLVIDGFFDSCDGRGIIEPKEEPPGDDAIIQEFRTIKSEDRKPRFSVICDGRKAVNRVTGEPSLCKKSGKEFWWCENSQCYEIARKPHKPLNWKDYSLADILRVLEIEYNEDQYEKLLGTINRANRYFEHLSCRKCNKILKPADKDNYGFYRVSNFQCQDKECEEHNNIIYLSHCANGACQDIVDSRDSVKCKPEGYHQNCGWYICNNCFACCSSEKISGRVNAYNFSGQEYKCHTEGHRDKGILCCNKCGEEMTEKEQHGKLYKKQLDWFIEQKENHRNIVKYGTRRDGKWWFIWSQGTFSFEDFRKHLKNLYSTGFNIPDYNILENTTQLIAEPYRENIAPVFICSSCDNIYKTTDLEEFDYARQNSISKYHNRIFRNQNVE